MAWNKIKSMFVVSDQPAADVDQALKDLEKYELPAGEVASAARRARRPRRSPGTDRFPGALRSGRHPQHRRGGGRSSGSSAASTATSQRPSRTAAAKAFLGRHRQGAPPTSSTTPAARSPWSAPWPTPSAPTPSTPPPSARPPSPSSSARWTAPRRDRGAAEGFSRPSARNARSRRPACRAPASSFGHVGRGPAAPACGPAAIGRIGTIAVSRLPRVRLEICVLKRVQYAIVI
jgi:hypothetical protein